MKPRLACFDDVMMDDDAFMGFRTKRHRLNLAKRSQAAPMTTTPSLENLTENRPKTRKRNERGSIGVSLHLLIFFVFQ